MSIWTSLLFTQGHVAHAKLATSLLNEKSAEETKRCPYSTSATHGKNIKPSLDHVSNPPHSDHGDAAPQSTNAPGEGLTNAYGGRIPWLSFR
jgi:hypothetical protein